MDRDNLVYVVLEDKDISFNIGSSPVTRGIIGIFSTEDTAKRARGDYPGNAIVVEYKLNKVEIGV